MDSASKLQRPQRTSLFVAALIPSAALCLLSSATPPPQEPVDLEGTHAILEETMKNRRLFITERRAWAEKKLILEDQVNLSKAEISDLNAATKEAKQEIKDKDESRLKLVEERDAAMAVNDELAKELVTLEERVRSLIPKLPQPLLETIRPISQQIPNKDEDSKLAISERYRNVAGVLSMINKFHREISLHSEVRDMGDNRSLLVDTLYLGISKAYFANGDGTVGGFGKPSADGWIWTRADEHAAKIAEAIAIYRDDEIAAFVQLPVVIDQ